MAWRPGIELRVEALSAEALRRSADVQRVWLRRRRLYAIAGLAPLGLRRRPRDLATQQAAASVGQLALGYAYTQSWARHSRTVGQVLLTSDDMVRRAHYRNAQRTFDRLLSLGIVPIVNENDTVATDEIKFGDNDNLSAAVANLVGAELLVMLSDVGGLHPSDPRAVPESPCSDECDPWHVCATRPARVRP